MPDPDPDMPDPDHFSALGAVCSLLGSLHPSIAGAVAAVIEVTAKARRLTVFFLLFFFVAFFAITWPLQFGREFFVP
jgi:hypothetical protein